MHAIITIAAPTIIGIVETFFLVLANLIVKNIERITFKFVK